MNELIVDVHNRCKSNKRCKCSGNKRHLSVRTGTVKGTNFGYCTHDIDSQHIRTTQISSALWKNVELERIGFSNLFETAYSITVFYNKTYDYDPQLIKKPLLIRSKDAGRNTHWFENVGGYANKRWQRIDEEAGKGNYPEGNRYYDNPDFNSKLKAVSCRLFVTHRIHIDFYKGNNYEIKCDICSDKLEINVKRDKADKAPGYTKYSYSGTFSDNSILVYKGRQLTFQRRTRVKTGYYVPVPVDKDDFNIISAYYWDNDIKQDNPLLIELFGTNGFSYWIENISITDKDGNSKHDKWRALPWTEHLPDELKGRLDLLNCIYNKVVQIKIGNPGECHPKRHILHRNRISYGYSEDYGTDPVLFSHKYWNSEGTRKSLNISEIYVGNDKQKFSTNGTPFQNVTRFTAFVSPCDKDKPFLICLEYDRDNNYKWYERKDKDGDWKEYKEISGKPDNVKHRLGSILEGIRQGLGIGGCNQITGAEGIQLDVNETVNRGKSFHTYQYNYSNKKVSIFVTKAENDPLIGFFKNTHKVYSKIGTFVASSQLKDRNKIIAGSGGKISSVKEVEVHFWDANPKVPILLGITTKTQQEDTTYYGTLNQRWGPDQVKDMGKQQALDHQNCQKNQAIPIELTDPTDLERFKAKGNPSSCLKYKSVRLSQSGPPLPDEAKTDYNLDTYNITPGTTKISRITYNNKPTDIMTTNDVISQLRIYKWNKSEVPLLVEFKKSSGGSDWFENLGGKDPDYTKWKRLPKTESDNFYKSGIMQETLTDKLDEINCKINEVVQLDISQNGYKYCHCLHSGHNKRIQVSKENKDRYSGFIGYEHKPAKDQTILKISSIYNGKGRQRLGVFSIPKEVSKVTVYFPECPKGTPVAIKIEQNGIPEEWLKRTSSKNTWEHATNHFISKGNNEIEIALENIKNSIDDVCGQSPPPPRFTIPQTSSVPAGSEPPEIPSDSGKDDKRFDWNDILKEAESIENDENKAAGDNIVRQEYEDEELVKDQNDATLMKAPIIVDGNIVNVNGTPVTDGTVSKTPKRVTMKEPPSIIIEINRDTGTKIKTTYNISGEAVKLERDEKPEESGFYMFVHEPSDGLPFKVEKVKHGNNTISQESLGFSTDENIDCLAVWYWKGDKNHDKPLLIEILKENGDYVYSFNNGNLKWERLSAKSNDSTLELTGESLEQILDELNCKHNDAITMNITKKVSITEVSYCCDYHIQSKKIFVEKMKHILNGSNSTEYYKHQISNGVVLTKIKYYWDGDNDNNDRTRIITKGLEFPINGAVSVYVYYCNGNPAIVYVNITKKWYKRKNQNSHYWEEVSTNLSGTDPDNIKSCDDFNKIKGELEKLGCNGSPNCITSSRGITSTVVATVASLPKAVIKLKEKPTESSNATPYKDLQKNIQVTRTPYPYPPRSDFYRYTHENSNIGKQLKLERVEDDESVDVGVIGEVEKLNAYYWTGNTGKALLVEAIRKDNPKYIYYENDKNGNWKIYNTKKSGQLTQDELLQKLTLLNCEINNVVQIDVSKTEGSYCHDGHGSNYNKKGKITDVTGNKLGMYKAYSHTLNNSGGGTFNISGFTKNGRNATINFGNDLTLPVMKAERVVVYFCKSDFLNPLLMHIPEANGKQWFQKPTIGTVWESTVGLSKENEYSKIVDLLDDIHSPCKPPEVTIDVYKRSIIGIPTEYYGGTSGNWINVNDGDVTVTGFTTYKHTVRDNFTYFSVENFKYHGDNVIGDLGKTYIKYVKEVYVFYWTPLEATVYRDKSRPLLVKVTTQDHAGGEEKSTYYENSTEDYDKNDKWEEWSPKSNPVDAYTLKSRLKLLNCKLNNAVVIDFNQRDTTYDACEESALDLAHGERIQVSEDQSTSDRRLGGYVVYKHTLNNGSGPFHIMEFQNNGVNLAGIDAVPILDVETVKVYFCSKDTLKIPLLLYYKTSRATHHWYKNSNPDNDRGKWESAGLSNTDDPESSHEKILKVLNNIPSECNPAPNGNTARFFATATGSALAGLGIYGGPLAGSGLTGLTGLGWWMFKRYKGDPWVRQI